MLGLDADRRVGDKAGFELGFAICHPSLLIRSSTSPSRSFARRFAHETAIVGNFRLSGLYLAGSDDQKDVGPTGVNLSR
jgi:hypothetical protein